MTRETAQRAAILESQIADAEVALRVAAHHKATVAIDLEVPYEPTNPDDEAFWHLEEELSSEARAEIKSIIIRDLGTQKALAEGELLKL